MLYEIVNEEGTLTTFQVPNPSRSSRSARLQPLRKGDQAPLFRLAKAAGSWNDALGSLNRDNADLTLLDLLTERPLVLSFYCPCWNTYAPKHLATLRDAYAKIRALGGELLVLSNDPPRSVAKFAERHDLPFSIVSDADNTVARAFGIYSESAPVWQRVAGISDDVFLPAAYVIGRNRRIAYDFVDENLDQSLAEQLRDLLTAVYAQKS